MSATNASNSAVKSSGAASLNIIFDLDNTLTHREQTLRKYIGVFTERFADELHASCDVEMLASRIIELDSQGYAGHLPRSEAICQLAVWKQPPPVGSLVEHWQSWIPRNPMPMVALHETLAALKAAGCKLGIITNGTVESQSTKIDGLGIREYFDVILISEQCDFAKPDRRIFELALNKLGVAASNTVYIGDHPINDGADASEAGMRAIWLAGFMAWPDNTPAAEHQVRSLAEAAELALSLGGAAGAKLR